MISRPVARQGSHLESVDSGTYSNPTITPTLLTMILTLTLAKQSACIAPYYRHSHLDCSKECGCKLGIGLESELGLVIGFDLRLWLETARTSGLIFRILAASTVYTVFEI